jgi:cell division septation protein DedD
VVRVISLILLMLAGCAETSYRSSNPSIPDAANLLREGGKAYARGDCKNAIELFSSLLEIVPEDVDTMLKIARCSYLLGNSESALAQYRAVLRIDPKSRSAHYNILFIQLESLVETSSAVIENAPPKRDDEEALLAVAKGIISSVTNPRDVANPAALSTAASSGSVDADPVDPESLAPTPAEPSKVTISGSVDADPVDPESLAPTPAELSKVTISGSVDAGPLEPESLSPPSLASMSDAMAAKNPGEWFVNIGAYASELSAENWSLRLQNSGYDAVVEDVRTAEGKMLKRVRLTGFDSEEAAQSVAIELEADYGTGPLWVGQVTK